MAYNECPFRTVGEHKCIGSQCQLWVTGSPSTSSKPSEGQCAIKMIGVSLSSFVQIAREMAQRLVTRK